MSKNTETLKEIKNLDPSILESLEKVEKLLSDTDKLKIPVFFRLLCRLKTGIEKEFSLC